MRRWGIVLLGFCLLLAGCGGTTTTAANAANVTPTAVTCSQADLDAIHAWGDSLLKEWDDATTLANSTPKIQLSDRIADLQRIRREAATKALPACAESTRPLLLSFMDSTIDAFTAFLGNQPDDVVQSKFADANAKEQQWADALKHLP